MLHCGNGLSLQSRSTTTIRSVGVMGWTTNRALALEKQSYHCRNHRDKKLEDAKQERHVQQDDGDQDHLRVGSRLRVALQRVLHGVHELHPLVKDYGVTGNRHSHSFSLSSDRRIAALHTTPSLHASERK